MVLHSILLVWLIAKVFKTIAPTVEIKWLFIVAQYFAVCFLGSIFLMFAYLYARGKPLSILQSILINIPPAFFFIVVVTNSRHHLFYTSYDFLGDTFGPLFYAYMLFTYLYLAAGIYLCATCFKKQFGKKEVQAKFFIAGIMLPLFVNILYVSGITEPRFDITPVTTNVSLLFFAYAVYKYQFLDIVPAGIFLLLNRLKEGVVVIDRGNNIIYKNKAVYRIFQQDFTTVDNIDTFLRKISGEKNFINNLISGLDRNKTEIKKELSLGKKQKYFKVYARLIRGKNYPVYLLVFSNITTYREMIYSLKEKNRLLVAANDEVIKYKKDLKGLALIEERNRIAGEIHDILGHSLTLILNILESSYILLDTDRSEAENKIQQALIEAKKSLDEINQLYKGSCRNEGKKNNTINQLRTDLNNFADKFRTAGLRVKVKVLSKISSIKKKHFSTIIRMSREALTNSLKHGKAEKVNIIIRVNTEEIDIYILDNGTGCENLKKGNGLQGMEERIKRLAGEFFCGSPEGKGFNIHAKIPL